MRAERTESRVSGLLARIGAWAREVRTVWARRRVLYELASLDDHLLRDMGITRQDVQSVIADPALGDPTERLAARAGQARRGRRATALEQQRWIAMLDEAAVPEPLDGAAAPHGFDAVDRSAA